MSATNAFGHPTQEALDRLHAVGMNTYWTSAGKGAAPVAGEDFVAGHVRVELAPTTHQFTVMYGAASHTYDNWMFPPAAPALISPSGSIAWVNPTLTWHAVPGATSYYMWLNDRASMGGELTYYINGIDDRVKAAVGIAVAGDWRNVMQYEGAWLYHGLYYYTRDGMQTGEDGLNRIASCDDPTLQTFLDYFDPIRYAPTQHGALLTIIGSHDQYFVAPGIDTTFTAVQSAGTSDRFIKRLFIAPNGKHGVVDGPDAVPTILTLLGTIDRWLKYAFEQGPIPALTPSLTMGISGSSMVFRVTAAAGAAPVLGARLHVASQMDSVPELACDFATVPLYRPRRAAVLAADRGNSSPTRRRARGRAESPSVDGASDDSRIRDRPPDRTESVEQTDRDSSGHRGRDD